MKQFLIQFSRSFVGSVESLAPVRELKVFGATRILTPLEIPTL